MSNILILSPPYHGHISTALGIAVTLKKRGHHVIFASEPRYQPLVNGAGLKWVYLEIDADPFNDMKNSCSPIISIIENNSVHLIINDASLYRPLLAAEITGVVSVSFDSTCPVPSDMNNDNKLVLKLNEYLPKLINQQRQRNGLPVKNNNTPIRLEQLGVSDELHLIMVYPQLVYENSPLPPSSHVVGPVLFEPNDFPVSCLSRELQSQKSTVVISTSSLKIHHIINETERYLSKSLLAFGDHSNFNAVFSLHSHYKIESDSKNISIDYQAASHHTYFPRTSLLISSGGVNTLQKAIKYGIPNLIFPIGFGSSFVGEQCEKLGIGKVLPKDITPQELLLISQEMITSPHVKNSCSKMAAATLTCKSDEKCGTLIEKLL
ncbi:glycosyltransferase [Cytobacillus oceanisediminis]|uniref:glycosyltransferase n=1 Tax=Cytobacillus oceanisediminis TaxID=665099 RepID=UPI001C2192C2|nr:hypothetical protein [Cytobacillus oceanisediminis]MBU8772062.1 hypothetical protein [Cytobacillus oceanisediminis]